MNNSDNIISSADMVSRVFGAISKKDITDGNRVLDAWPRILRSIHSKNPETGANLAAHSRIVDLKNGILLIEADHPGWIELLQLYKKFILECLQRAVPELTIGSLAFRLTGSKAELTVSDSEEARKKEREQLSQRLDKEESLLEKKGFGAVSSESENKKELPENLKNLFDQFRNDMLTNGE